MKWKNNCIFYTEIFDEKNLICGLFSKSVKCSRTYNYVFYADVVREIKIFGRMCAAEFGLVYTNFWVESEPIG